MAIAHLRVDSDGTQSRHSLEDHLRSTAALAEDFAAPFSTRAWAALAGLWHDLGKYRPGFQAYIRQANDPDAHVEGRVAGPERTHSVAGALHALDVLKRKHGPTGQIAARVLPYVIGGHHAGLDDWHGGLKARLDGEDAKREHAEAVAATSVEFRGREPWRRRLRNITNVRA